MMKHGSEKTLRWSTLAEEPFRLFFPVATAAAVLGVALWPLHFLGLNPVYPGPGHGRIMAHGFFGGYILGFLGTALPRLVSAPRLSLLEIGWWGAVYLTMVTAHALGRTPMGDVLFGLLLLSVMLCLGQRLVQRRDVPPPGFVLVPLAFLCGLGGAAISILEYYHELPFFWVKLRPLIYYQGFVLLPVLGVSGFFLPRLFGLPNRHEFPESRQPPPGWVQRAGWSAAVGAGVLLSFALEAAGWVRAGHGIRLVVSGWWLLQEVPIHRGEGTGNCLRWGVRVGIVCLLAGFLAETLFPGYRVALLHLVFTGGLGLVTLSVATRVIYGHSGQRSQLDAPNRWFQISAVLMLIGMATRVSGDFWPAIMMSHYNYGALIWILGAGLWAWKVLPNVAIPDPED